MWVSSERWAVSNTRYLPSLDQAICEPGSPLARKLTGRASPAADGTTQTLRNDFLSVTEKASQRLSGDQAGRAPWNGATAPVKSTTSLAGAPPSAKVIRRISRRLRV